MEFHWYIHVLGRLVEGQHVLHHYGFEPLWTLGSCLVWLFCSAALGFLSGWGCNADMQLCMVTLHEGCSVCPMCSISFKITDEFFCTTCTVLELVS